MALACRVGIIITQPATYFATPTVERQLQLGRSPRDERPVSRLLLKAQAVTLKAAARLALMLLIPKMMTTPLAPHQVSTRGTVPWAIDSDDYDAYYTYSQMMMILIYATTVGTTVMAVSL